MGKKLEPEYKIVKKNFSKEDREAIDLIEEALFESMNWGEVYRAVLVKLSNRAESFLEYYKDELKDAKTKEHKDELKQGIISCETHIDYIREMLIGYKI